MGSLSLLRQDPRLAKLALAAEEVKKLLISDTRASMIRCRAVMELAIRWMYEADSRLVPPEENTLAGLLSQPDFRKIVQSELWKRLEFIHQLGALAERQGQYLPREKAEAAFSCLASFLTFLSKSYGSEGLAPAPRSEPKAGQPVKKARAASPADTLKKRRTRPAAHGGSRTYRLEFVIKRALALGFILILVCFTYRYLARRHLWRLTAVPGAKSVQEVVNSSCKCTIEGLVKSFGRSLAA